jgi:hypothetical protein
MNNTERALRKGRSEELRTIAEAVETFADYTKTGFKEMLERMESIERKIEERGLKRDLKSSRRRFKISLEYYKSVVRGLKN